MDNRHRADLFFTPAPLTHLLLSSEANQGQIDYQVKLLSSQGEAVRKAKTLVRVLVFTAIISALSFSAHASITTTELNSGAGKTNDNPSLTTATLVNDAPVRAAYGNLPFIFILNAGQIDAKVRYYSSGPGYGLYFTQEEAVLVLVQQPSRNSYPKTLTPIRAQNLASSEMEQATKPVALALQFLGSNPNVKLEGQREGNGKVNYLIGSDPAQWHTGLSTYQTVAYRELWPGVDLLFRGAKGQLKYEFVLQPGTSAEAIRLAYRGAESLSLDEAGNLLIRTPLGVLTDERPRSHQEIEGKQVPVESRFALEQRPDGESVYGFVLSSDYDPRYPLIIDPGLVYSTYLGGSLRDVGNAIAVDAVGNAYVTGRTKSANFPKTIGSSFFKGGSKANRSFDAFVVKIDPSQVDPAKQLVYATFLGGSAADFGFGIAVDSMCTSNCSAYVTGLTYSPDFPTQNGAFGKIGGKSDAFVAKLNGNGSALLYSTYLGGGGPDEGRGIAVDGFGKIYTTGKTRSSNFPVTPFAVFASSRGQDDAFVTKLDPAASGLASLVYSTYLGGTGPDIGYAIDVACPPNPAELSECDAAYVTGKTSSANFPTSANFPIPTKSFDTVFNDRTDAFVTKLSADGSALLYSTYLGGSGVDKGFGIAVDGLGNAYVTGQTSSTTLTGDFSIVSFSKFGLGGGLDAFVTKLNPAASGSASIVYSISLGGSGGDIGNGIAVDALGNACVTGQTSSTNFPTVNPLPQNPATGVNVGSSGDAFVTKLNANGSVLISSTYLGGRGVDKGFGIAVDDFGNAYVTGQTSSTNFPTVNPLPQNPATGVNVGSSGDAFVAKLSLNEAPVANGQSVTTAEEDTAKTITLSANDIDSPSLTFSTVSGPIHGTLSAVSLLSCVASGAGSFCTASVTYTPVANYNNSGVSSNVDSFTFKANDGITNSNVATVSITVTAVNDAPVAANDSYSVDEDTALTVPAPGVLGNDTDVDGDPLTVVLGSGPGASQGTLTLNANGSFTFQPVTNFNGNASFTYKAKDPSNAESNLATVTITVTPVNDLPVADSKMVTTDEDTAVVIPLSGTDIETVAANFAWNVGMPAHGTLTGTAPNLTYTPAPNDNEPDDFTYTIPDRGDLDNCGIPGPNCSAPLTSVPATVSITVTPVNDAPVLTPIGNKTVDEGQLLEFTVSATDVEGDSLTFLALNLPPGATFDPATQKFAWTPNSAQAGVYFVQFTVSDGLASDSAEVMITGNDTILDTDFDGVPDLFNDLTQTGPDNCLTVPNTNQSDMDADGVGDVCDNCPLNANPNQADSNANGVGDACEGPVVGAGTVSSPGAPGGQMIVTFTTTFNATSNFDSFLPPDPYNVICKVINNATGQEVPEERSLEGPPIALYLQAQGGNLLTVPAGTSQPFTTTFDLSPAFPNLPEGSYTIQCTQVSLANDPELLPDGTCLSDAQCPRFWRGTAPAQPQTVFIGTYAFSGFFSPLPNEVFNLGSTVPVKFQLKNSAGDFVSTATATLTLQKLNSADGPIDATPAGGRSGSTFRYDFTDNQYVYNLSTKPLSTGSWQLEAHLDDGTTKFITIILQEKKNKSE